MPAFLVPIISAIGVSAGGALGAFLIMEAAFVASAAVLLGGLALSYSQAKNARRKARDAFNASQVDRLVTVAGTTEPRLLVMGRVRKGGQVFFKAATGANNSVFVMCVALAAHEIDAIEQIYLNDEPVTVDGSGNVTTAPYALSRTASAVANSGATGVVVLPNVPITGTVAAHTGVTFGPEGNAEQQAVSVAGSTVTTAPYATVNYQYTETISKANIRGVLGSPTQPADSRLMTLFQALWTAAHQAKAVAYLICEFTYDETAFPSGLPNVTAVIRGAKIYDPRTATTAWTQNPALMVRHVYTHADFGQATPTAAEDARIVTAANQCGASTNYSVNGVVATTDKYRAATVVPFGSDGKTALDDLAQAMAGAWAFSQGELYLKAGTFVGSVMSLTEADLAVVTRTGANEQQNPIAISVHKERAQKFNSVTPQIWDKAQMYKRTALTPLQSSALVARDGSVIARTAEMPAVFHAPQALHIAGVMMRDARDPLTVTLPVKMRAYPLEMFDVIDLTVARYGWTAKLFTVVGRGFSAGGVLQLTLKETSASIYAVDADFLAQGYAENTSLPNAWYVPLVGALTIASGTSELLMQADGTVTSRMRVSWPAIDHSGVTDAGVVEIQYRTAVGGVEWLRVEVAGSDTDVVVDNVQDGTDYVIRARAKTVTAVGDWGAQVSHRVVGKTEPPPDVLTFHRDGDRLSWGAVTAIDLAGYEIRFNYSVNTWWPTASKLNVGLLTDSPYQMPQRPAGLVTLMIKAVDTSGNESANAAVIVANLGDIVPENLLLQWPQAPTFTGGVIEGASVSAGVLQANSLDRFFESADEPMFKPDTDVFYPPSSYSDVRYTWVASSASPGTLLLAHTVSASQYSIEVRRASQDAMFTPTGDLMFGGSGEFFGPPGSWVAWPGSLQLSAGENVDFRIIAAGGAQQGQISVATVQLDVPDVLEDFSDLVVSSAGTRLPITQTYRDIVNVQITVQADGGAGITARAEDKDHILGPLVRVYNAAGTAVNGLIDATVQGY